jgi:His-Xaa-Ser system radical SAM maturase HxsC
MIKLHSNKNVIASSSEEALILKVSTNPYLPLILRKDIALIVDSVDNLEFDGYPMVFSTDEKDRGHATVQFLGEDLRYLTDGDIIRVLPAANSIRAIYRINSPSNFLFTTERCNSFCLMCSQPPRDIDDGYLVDEMLRAIPLIDRGTKDLGLTGGEPTLLGENFFTIVKAVKSALPETGLHILTNGRSFADPAMAYKLAKIKHPDLVLGIPLYSDVSQIHDFVVQADGAYDETVRGILNLKQHQQKVEIRVVVHKQTYERLPQLAEFIGRNLQFVDHVALMGLEVIGFTLANMDELWIEPLDYADQLSEAVRILSRYKVRTSIYNLQKCLLPKHLWPFAVKSISDWKNKYYEECEGCAERQNCGGFFASSDIRRSIYIKAIDVNPSFAPAEHPEL